MVLCISNCRLSECLPKKGETDSENIFRPIFCFGPIPLPTILLNLLDPKTWVWGHTGEQNRPFWLKTPDFHRENVVFTVLTKTECAHACPSNFFAFSNGKYPRLQHMKDSAIQNGVYAYNCVWKRGTNLPNTITGLCSILYRWIFYISLPGVFPTGKHKKIEWAPAGTLHFGQYREDHIFPMKVSFFQPKRPKKPILPLYVAPDPNCWVQTSLKWWLEVILSQNR